MPEQQRSMRSSYKARPSFSLWSPISASASVDRCSFASNARDHDFLASLHLAGQDHDKQQESSSCGLDRDPESNRHNNHSRLFRKAEKAKVCNFMWDHCSLYPGYSLFKYSAKMVVFAYYFPSGLGAITLSIDSVLISTFFTRAKTAVAVGILSFLGAFFPYYTVNDEAVSMIVKVVASLLSSTAFALGSVNFADYEHAHVGLRWSNYGGHDLIQRSSCFQLL